MIGSFMVIWSGSKKTETIDATDALQQFDDDDDKTNGQELAKSDLLRRSHLKSPRLMKSPLLRSPARLNKQQEADEMEFVSVRRNARMPSTGGDAQRVVWSSMKR